MKLILFSCTFLAPLAAAQNQTWIRQLGTPFGESVQAATSDGASGVFVGGHTFGDLGGANAGEMDAWLARYDDAGNQLWIRQFGNAWWDAVYAAAPDGSGGVLVGGRSHGSFGGPNVGVADVWLARFEVAPPVSTFCCAGTTTNGCVPAIRGSGTPSANATSGFTVAVDDVEGQTPGVLFYGIDNGGFTPLAWSANSSFLCVKSPVQRAVALNSGGTANQCDGVLAFDWNTYRAANSSALGQPFAAGAIVYMQGWLRDPAAPKSTSLSDGLRFVAQP